MSDFDHLPTTTAQPNQKAKPKDATFGDPERDRMVDLALQRAAQFASSAVNAANPVQRKDAIDIAVTFGENALRVYKPDGKATAKFTQTLDGISAKLERLIPILDPVHDKTHLASVQSLLARLQAAFAADGWKAPATTRDAKNREGAADMAGATTLDATEQTRLGELHLRSARDHLERGLPSFAARTMGGMAHATREITTAYELLHDKAVASKLGPTTAAECELVEAALDAVAGAVVNKDDRKSLHMFARRLDAIAADLGRPVKWFALVTK